jgi:hypothetical protein
VARVAITETETTKAGAVATYDSFNTGDGNFIANSGQNVMLHVKNADASAHVIHIITQKTEAGGKAVKDYVETVAAGAEEFFGPFANADFGVSGNVYVDCYDASGPTFDADDAVSGGTKNTTGVTAAAIKMGSL